MLSFLPKLSSDSDFSLQKQLRSQLTAAIIEGHVPCQTPLPSTRKLAMQLGISRNTVIHTYQQLIDDGYLIARQRAGYYVNQEIIRDSIRNDAAQIDNNSGQLPIWSNFLKRQPSSDNSTSYTNGNLTPTLLYMVN